jgi:hypothetical protein
MRAFSSILATMNITVMYDSITLYSYDGTHQVKVNKPINVALLKRALSTFAGQGLIAEEEIKQVIRAYNQANPLIVEPGRTSAAEQTINTHLLHLYFKALELDKASSVMKLYDNLHQEMLLYFENKTPISYKKFKENCEGAIDAVRPMLEKNSGVQQILNDIVFTISLAGIGYLITGLATVYFNNRCSYKTDSANYAIKYAKRLEDLPVTCMMV